MKHLLLCAVWAIIGYAVSAQTLRNDIDSTLSLLMTQDVDERMATYYSFADRNRFSKEIGNLMRQGKKEEAEEVKAKIEEKYYDLDLDIRAGKQPVYSFLIGVE